MWNKHRTIAWCSLGAVALMGCQPGTVGPGHGYEDEPVAGTASVAVPVAPPAPEPAGLPDQEPAAVPTPPAGSPEPPARPAPPAATATPPAAAPQPTAPTPSSGADEPDPGDAQDTADDTADIEDEASADPEGSALSFDAGSGELQPDGNTVIYRIPDGTGGNDWNSPDDPIRVKRGMVLRLIDEDTSTRSGGHYLHTYGQPCPHGTGPIGDGYDCVISERAPLGIVDGVAEHNIFNGIGYLHIEVVEE